MISSTIIPYLLDDKHPGAGPGVERRGGGGSREGERVGVRWAQGSTVEKRGMMNCTVYFSMQKRVNEREKRELPKTGGIREPDWSWGTKWRGE
jgi:hypothetical protein